MEPVIPDIRMPVVGDKVDFYDPVHTWLNNDLKKASENGHKFIVQNVSSRGSNILIEIKALNFNGSQSFLIKPNGKPAWITEDWYVFCWADGSKKSLDLSDLKKKNTQPGATNCASCGDPLKIPAGLSCLYQHCPRCEP